MNKALQKQDLSYFELRLQELLNQSYPELAKDMEFVNQRSKLALQTYTDAIATGNNHLEASHLANEVLFASLPFSKMDMTFDVVCNEFSREIPDDELRSFAVKMYPKCLSIFDKYGITEYFWDNPMYDTLYTELTGTIQLWMDTHVIA